LKHYPKAPFPDRTELVDWEKWAGPPRRGDERETYSRAELLKMDAAFSAALERAFAGDGLHDSVAASFGMMARDSDLAWQT
jgi:hypothetical protein